MVSRAPLRQTAGLSAAFTEPPCGVHHSDSVWPQGARTVAGMTLTRDDVPTIAGVFNLRDLGGHASTLGGVTRSGVVFRADGLHRTNAAGADAVAALGIERLIDLRTIDERTEDGVFGHAAVQCTHIPLIERTWLWEEEFKGKEGDLLLAGYLQIVSENRARLVETLEAIAASNAPVVFHCTAGKDRTGVVAALLLGLAGVDEATIVADYALSGPAMVEMRRWYEEQRSADEMSFEDRMRERGIDPHVAMKLIHAKPETMQAFLAYVGEQSGSIERFVADLGVAGATVDRLRDRLIG